MTVEEAKEYARTMSYTEAVYNALQGKQSLDGQTTTKRITIEWLEWKENK